MIQQNHGEKPYGHGYVLWDIPNRKHTHHEVQNDYGYYTIEVRDGKCVSDLSKLPKKARLRVRYLIQLQPRLRKLLQRFANKLT